MSRVVLLIRSLERGGAERQLAELASRLSSNAFEVVVLTFYPGGPIWEELQQVPLLRVESLGKSGRWDVIRFAYTLAKTLRRHKPHVIHCYLVEPCIFGVLAARIMRVGSVVWALRSSDVDLSAYDRFQSVTFKLAARLSRFADAIIANSSAGREYHVKHGYYSDRFTVIPNGIDTNRFRPRQRSQLRQRWLKHNDDILVGVVARMDPIKGHLLLLDAIVRLKQRYSGPFLRFVCVGGGSEHYRRYLKGQCARLAISEEVVWEDERADMSGVYPEFDFLCSPSLSEGFSNVIAEAMASGLSCVVTDVGDSAHIVADTGFVARRNDPEDLAGAIEKMAGLSPAERTALGQVARRRIADLFGVDRMVNSTSAVYDALTLPMQS